jgi:hypothetical protein
MERSLQMGQPQQGQKKILAVDDEVDLRMLSSLASEYLGFKLIHFTIHKKHYQTIRQATMTWLSRYKDAKDGSASVIMMK